MPIIFSTLTCDNEYVGYRATQGDVAIREHSVVIKGGANAINTRTLITPLGVATTVSDADLEFLESNVSFLEHKRNGYLTVDAVKDPRDADLAAAGMEGRDDSAPLTDQDYEAEGKEPPVVNKAEMVEVPAPQSLVGRRATNRGAR